MLAALLLTPALAAAAQGLDDAFARARDAVRAASSRPAVVVDRRATGSWYRKLVSPPTRAHDGILAWGVLPAPSFDPARWHEPAPGEPAWTRGPLDSPSVYVGLSAPGVEIDAGLKWDHVHDAAGRDDGTYAWRVFWRVDSRDGNVWRNPAPGAPDDVYLRPGEPFSLRLEVRADGTVVLNAHGAGGVPSSTVEFPVAGLGRGARRAPLRFKRVHAVDQFVEGPDGRRRGDLRDAVPTRATLAGGRWTGVLLLGGPRAPLTGALAADARGADEAAAYAAVFPSAFPDRRGGEAIVVRPPAR